MFVVATASRLLSSSAPCHSPRAPRLGLRRGCRVQILDLGPLNNELR